MIKFNKFVFQRYIAILLIGLFFMACSQKVVRNVEARDDDQEYQAALQEQGTFEHVLYADQETEPVTTDSLDDDAADDPAIWLHAMEAEKSVIFGSNKKAGIHAYNLEGEELQFVPWGRINNVDVRQEVKFGVEGTLDVLAGSNRADSSIVLFIIDKNGKIAEKPDFVIDLGDTEPYGFCLYQSSAKVLYAFVNDKYGNVEQHGIIFGPNLDMTSKLVRKLKLPSQVEGMVADDELDILYVGEEQAGIHIFSAVATDAGKGTLVKESSDKNPKIRFDIEGLALLPVNGKKYLLASSQGNFSYALFDTETRKYVDSFVIKDKKYDGAEETDGLEVMTANFGKKYPNGILVVQDGFNFDRKKEMKQNFKIVDLEKVIEILPAQEK